MPKRVLSFSTNKIVDYYIKKYAHLHIEGEEHLREQKGPVIFISNHLSNSDGLILNKLLKGRNVNFVAGIKLSNNSLTSLGINIIKTIQIKPNSADKEAITKIIETIKAGESVCIFPEGTRSRTATMIEAKKGILLIAKLAKVPIVPIALWGTEKFMPIHDGDMGAEGFHEADIHIKIGAALSLPEKKQGEDKGKYEERAVFTLMRKIAAMLPEQYQGVYGEDKYKSM